MVRGSVCVVAGGAAHRRHLLACLDVEAAGACGERHWRIWPGVARIDRLWCVPVLASRRQLYLSAQELSSFGGDNRLHVLLAFGGNSRQSVGSSLQSVGNSQ